MRHNSSNRRQRNRGNSGGNRRTNQRSQVFDSNGPDVRIRGTAHQVTEKYMALAKDAASSGDYIMEQNYLQHAEHYQRIMNSWVVEQNDAPQANEEKSGELPEKQADKKPSRARKKKSDDSDLSLPGSILGDEVKVKSKDKVAESA